MTQKGWDSVKGRMLVILAILYPASSLVLFPVNEKLLAKIGNLHSGPVALSRPLVLSGDAPHHLVAASSLIEDGDFDLSNNYRQARGGDWDLGTRFSSVDTNRYRHVDRDDRGEELSTHSPFFPLLLAVLVWPLRSTGWVESLCIWLTMAVALGGIALLTKQSGESRNWAIALALATPLWCYSRDLWTEPWVMTIWIAMLFSKNLVVLAGLGFLGTLIKYPFAVVPITIGLLALRQKNGRRAWTLLGSGLLGLVVVVSTIQYLFRYANHFSLLHEGIHAGFDWSFGGLGGLFLDPENGILWFSPFLAWGLWKFRNGGEVYLPAVVFFLVHASYYDWRGGTGFSARYLVPMLPVMVLAVAEAKPSGRLFKAALVYSVAWCFLAGFFPALVYDRTPWGVVRDILAHFHVIDIPHKTTVTVPQAGPTLNDFTCDCVAKQIPSQLNAGSSDTKVAVTVTNQSLSATWPALLPGRPITNAVNVSYHWLEGRKEIIEGRRALLSADLGPGESAEVELIIAAPEKPGIYTLRIEPVQEGIAWFSQVGGCKAEAMVRVIQ